MITKYPWFGPKRSFGWGWTPVTWEGWAATILTLAIILAAYLLFGRAPITTYITIGAVALLLVVTILTGTAPG
jgi:hypothetical protein